MNSRNKAIFVGLSGKIERYDERVADIIEKYTQELDVTKREARKYKDESAFIEQRKRECATDAKQQLAAASASFADDVRHSVEELRKELTKALSEPVDAGLLDQLRTVREFGVKPSRGMAEAWLDRNAGNLLGCAVIKSVLASNGAGFGLQYDGPEAFEADIRTLERLADAADHYAPGDAHNALCSLYSGEPRTVTRPDGTKVETGDTWGSVNLIIRRAEVEDTFKAISGMGERWAAGVTYELADQVSTVLEKESDEDTDETPAEPEPSAKIEDNDLSAELAKANAAERAEANRITAAGLKNYLR